MAKFQRATKKQAKLRAALFGPAGAGKTMSALRIAAGIGGPIAFIDTERGSASKYADRIAFDVLELQKRTIDDYISAIHAAAAEQYPVLVIDSMSHAWQELLEEVDRLARAKYKGNTWSAWSEGTPKQRKLIDAIQTYPGHVLATIRSRTEWTTEEVNGKKTPVRVGLAPETGKGAEYEFDLLIEISPEHIARVIKDRTGKFQDKLIEMPDEAFGKELAGWLDEGEEAPPQPILVTANGDGRRQKMLDRIREMEEALGEEAEVLAGECGIVNAELAEDADLMGYGKRLKSTLDARATAQEVA